MNGLCPPKAETFPIPSDRIVLNGLWQALPAVGPSADAPSAPWGSIWIPGSWIGGFAIYFHFTRWRQTRALSQLLANLGASFAADGNLFHRGSKTPLYYPDYVWDGDDPARYYRW